jgi:hypothetical protein
MTAIEKAIELHNKYYQVFEDLGLYTVLYQDTLPNKYAKQCALLCVDEILKTKVGELTEEEIECLKDIELFTYRYWQEVKKEIKEL